MYLDILNSRFLIQSENVQKNSSTVGVIREEKAISHFSLQFRLVLTEIAEYKLMSSVAGSGRPCPFEFWRVHTAKLPYLATIAKRIVVIQASSAESERHFLSGGLIVAENRSRLCPQSVESLIVLREAFINNQWPETQVSSVRNNTPAELEP